MMNFTLNISKLFNNIYISPLSRICWMMILLPLCMIFLWGVVCVSSRLASRTTIVQIWSFVCLIVAVGIAMVIFYMTVLRRGISERGIILIPFYSFYEARRQPEIYRQMLMNVFLFEPLGLTLPYGLRLVRRHQIVRVSILFCLVFSILIEICQGLFSRGRTEVDDVIMNILGASMGILCYKICNVERVIGTCLKST